MRGIACQRFWRALLFGRYQLFDGHAGLRHGHGQFGKRNFPDLFFARLDDVRKGRILGCVQPFAGSEHAGGAHADAVDGSRITLAFHLDAVAIAETQAAQRGTSAVDFSLYSLPIQTQAVYGVLLMIPIGALIMVIMRNIVGIDAFGTLMPVLIALVLVPFQIALWWHADQIADAAAREAVDSAQVPTATEEDGIRAAERFLDAAGNITEHAPAAGPRWGKDSSDEQGKATRPRWGHRQRSVKRRG